MLTVGELKKRLAEVNDDDLVYAYEGEDRGIAIVRRTGNKLREVCFIHAEEDL